MIAKSHYDDCPYGCNMNGLILDPETRSMVQCPHCSKIKKELLMKGYVESENDEHIPLSTALGIENEFLSTKYVYESVIPDGERLFIEEESLDWQKEFSENMYLNLTTGVLPTESICFGVSIKGRVERFAYPILAKAYLAGLSVGKFVSCSEFSRWAFDIANPMDDFYESDFLMMLVNEGCNLADISSAKGLMQTRALKGKPTVFVTTWTIEACSALLGFDGDSSLMMAKPVFVKYKTSKGSKHSSYINNLLGVENEVVGGSSDPKSVTMSDLMNL